MAATAMCPSPDELRLERIVLSRESITLVAMARRVAVPCPHCGFLCQRVRSRYVRTLDDLPWHGVRVRIEAHVRKFFCDTPGCPRHIFTERLSETTVPHARRTSRAATALEVIGFALGGRPGERLAVAMGLTGGAWVCKYIQIPALHEQATSRTRVLLMQEFGSLRVRGESAVGTPAWGRARPPVHGAGSCGHQCAAPAHDAAADRESRW